MNPVFCSECGSALDEKGNCVNTSCPNSKSKSPSNKKPTKSVRKPFVFTEKGKLIVPDCVNSDLDEVPIKQYDVARLQTLIKGARAEGRLQVTNKRLLFRSVGTSIVGPTSLRYEFSIEEIAGLEIRKESRLNFVPTLLLILLAYCISGILQPIFSPVYNSSFLSTLFPVLIAAAAVYLFVFLRNKHFLRYIAVPVLLTALPLNVSDIVQKVLGSSNTLVDLSLVITILSFIVSLFYLAFAPNLVIRILTKSGTPSVEIRRKDSIFSFQHNECTCFSQVIPGPDADIAKKELGALIREVQQTGRYTEM